MVLVRPSCYLFFALTFLDVRENLFLGLLVASQNFFLTTSDDEVTNATDSESPNILGVGTQELLDEHAVVTVPVTKTAVSTCGEDVVSVLDELYLSHCGRVSQQREVAVSEICTPQLDVLIT